MKCFLAISLLTLAPLVRPADFYSSKQIQGEGDKLLAREKPFASSELARYQGHYTLLAVRHATGSAEVHQHEADYFVVEKGSAVLLTGGNLVGAHTDKPGEIRGTSLTGAERHSVGEGDVIHIPAGEPHQLLIDKSKPFAYFVVKVMGQ